ncbi:MAG: sulfotransferase domain-containing protein [Chloroflexi bacterium]|nr:sulfotransferase domain-containing protein [Chloroflexota bacterium]MCI0574995.1 sulfotransferase domain-containing protein [Chloroflexota bacterium]MCI0645777.1 sulfotransferase domain-containing protein [Chloroflexota bacterium]MCI0727704.1 sulfotransferase domain-containing protein [Chloroflexota bacterium]
MSKERPLLAFMGHHKCATRWVNGILRPVCRELGLRRAVVWHPDMFNGNLPAFVAHGKIDFLAYTNADYECVKQLKAVRGFHVVRDPRDICVSAYFSHLHSHETKNWPELVEHRKRLQSLSTDEGLLLDMQFVEKYMNEMDSWKYEDPNFLQVKMEALTADPYRQFLKIFDFLGLLDEQRFTARRWLSYALARRLQRLSRGRISLAGLPERLPAERLLGIIWQNEFDRKSGGRRPGQEDQASHYRKGSPGDWRNHFKVEHIRYFKEQYNPLLLKLGYEENPDWT